MEQVNYPPIYPPAAVAAAPLPAGVTQAPGTEPGYNLLAQLRDLNLGGPVLQPQGLAQPTVSIPIQPMQQSVTVPLWAPQPAPAVTKPMLPGKTVTLMPEQQPHFDFLLDLVKNYSAYYFDESETGTGKTYCAGAIAQAIVTPEMQAQGINNLPMVVVCPANLRDRWREFFAEKQIFNYGVYSYEEMRGAKSAKAAGGVRQPKSGFVVRGTADDSFKVTDYFLQMLRYPGILLIFDEFHALDNKSAQFYAAQAMIVASINSGTSRVGFLSATPVDKEVHCENIMRACGIIHHKKLTGTHGKGNFALEGALEVINTAYQTQPEVTKDVLNKFNADVADGRVVGIRTNAQARDICYRLFVEVIHGLRQSVMKMPVPLDAKNYYMFVNADCMPLLQEGLQDLQFAARYQPETREVGAGKKDVHAIGGAMKKIHIALAVDMARVAEEYLLANPNHKVVLFTSSPEAVDIMVQRLARFGALKHDGTIPDHMRPPLIRAFQQHNNQYRAFCSTYQTGGQGVDLDDKFGDQPRLALGAPTYSLKHIIQAIIGRIRRMSTKSLPKSRMCYPGNYYNIKLVDILSALARKGVIMEEVTTDAKISKRQLDKAQKETDATFYQAPTTMYPNQYPSEYELQPPQDGKRYAPRL